MKELNLRNLLGTFIKTNNSNQNEIYYDKHNNNLIIFHPDFKTNTESICNSIRDEAYSYLMNKLNTNIGLVVYWTQVEGTTSDYTVYYDVTPDELNIASHEEALNILRNQTSDTNSMKYNSVKDGRLEPIYFQ